MSKYYSIHEFSKIIGVSAQTLRNWDANGKLHPHHTTVSGYRYYSDVFYSISSDGKFNHDLFSVRIRS